jgi:hypothetical protein
VEAALETEEAAEEGEEEEEEEALPVRLQLLLPCSLEAEGLRLP